MSEIIIGAGKKNIDRGEKTLDPSVRRYKAINWRTGVTVRKKSLPCVPLEINHSNLENMFFLYN